MANKTKIGVIIKNHKGGCCKTNSFKKKIESVPKLNKLRTYKIIFKSVYQQKSHLTQEIKEVQALLLEIREP